MDRLSIDLSADQKRALLKKLLQGRSASPAPRSAAAAGITTPTASPRFADLPAYLELKDRQRELASLGIANPYFRLHEGIAASTTRISGREYINFANYNYLELSGHPVVSAAAAQAIDKYGTSVSASRIASGERPVHKELEAAVARLLGVEDCLAFVGGYATNVTVIAHLFGPKDLVLHDALIHNSALMGCQLSGAQRLSFPHNDWRAVDSILRERRNLHEKVLILIEGAYSMDGDIAPLDGFIAIKERHGAMLFVDEAHSLGVLGRRGGGIGEHFAVASNRVDIWMGTFSKALAGCGGYIAGDAALVENLRYGASGFVYSVGMPAPIAAASLAAIKVMLAEPERVARLQSRSTQFRELAKAHGLDIGASGGTAIVPVIVGDSLVSLRLAQSLGERGINVQPVFYPAVEEGAARLRFFVTANHTEAQIRATVAATAQELSILQARTEMRQ